MDFLGVGTGELLVIATIALIVVGPKDLPAMLHKVGRFTARMRGMASEFRASFDEMARQTELEELRKEIESLKDAKQMGLADVRADVEGAFSAIDQDLATPGVSGMAPLAAAGEETAKESLGLHFGEAPAQPVALQPYAGGDRPA
jgi:sec-independent protein translocase protein TatB